jgi:hypothetical protein
VPSACKNAAKGAASMFLTSHPQLQRGRSGTLQQQQQTGRRHTQIHTRGETQGHQLPTAPQVSLGFPTPHPDSSLAHPREKQQRYSQSRGGRGSEHHPHGHSQSRGAGVEANTIRTGTASRGADVEANTIRTGTASRGADEERRITAPAPPAARRARNLPGGKSPANPYGGGCAAAQSWSPPRRAGSRAGAESQHRAPSAFQPNSPPAAPGGS